MPKWSGDAKLWYAKFLLNYNQIKLKLGNWVVWNVFNKVHFSKNAKKEASGRLGRCDVRAHLIGCRCNGSGQSGAAVGLSAAIWNGATSKSRDVGELFQLTCGLCHLDVKIHTYTHRHTYTPTYTPTHACVRLACVHHGDGCVTTWRLGDVTAPSIIGLVASQCHRYAN